MKIIILGGFLGAGKTTVLMDLAHYYVKHCYKNQGKTPVAIIENEVGSTGIDDHLIRKGNYNVQTLFSGCICCSMSGELINSIHEIQETIDPELLIIESTGVAYPDKIKKNISEEMNESAIIVTIFDAFRFKGLSMVMGDLFLGQLRDASLVLINKVDLVNEELLQEVIQKVKKHHQLNMIFPVSANQGVSQEIWNTIL